MRLREIAELVRGEVLGDGEVPITCVAEVQRAGPGDLVMVANRRLLPEAEASGASALLVSRDIERTVKPAVRVANLRLAFAIAMETLMPPSAPAWGIHPTCVLGERVRVGTPVALGPYVVVEDDVEIGDRAVIGAGTFIGRGTAIGEETLIYPNVTVREETVIGRRVILHSGVVIGADGFGYAQQEDGRHRKIPHRGRVVIEDEVEIGASTAVDRATLGETRIGRGTKIDNLCQVAHNVQIGRGVIIIAQTGLAGSARLEDHVMIAGQAGVVDHNTVGKGARIGTRAIVTKDIAPGADVSGFPAQPHQDELKAQAMVRRLPDLARRIEKLTQEVAALKRALAGRDRS